MANVLDRDFWRIVPGARIQLYLGDRKLKKQGVVLAVTKTEVKYRDIKTHGEMKSRPSNCRVLAGKPKKLMRFHIDEVAMQKVSIAAKKRARRIGSK